MRTFEDIDLAIDDDGNFLSFRGNLQNLGSIESVQKTIEWRLKTYQREWRSFNPFIAAGIGDFEGRKNTEETAELMKNAVLLAITSDNFIDKRNIEVDVVPIAADEVNIYISIKGFIAFDLDSKRDQEYIYKFNFNEGEIISLTGETR